MSSTYYTYNEGVEAKHLHLGNIVHDYRNPNDYFPYIEKTFTDVSESPPNWARSASLENYAMTLGKSPSDSADERGTQRYRIVAAAKTTRAEIKDPEEFFTSHTLTSPAAKKWLSSHLSAAESLAQGKSGPRPEIWMLTGLILMQHATWTLLESKDKFFKAGEKAPFNPSGVSAIRRSSVSDGIKPVFGYRATEEDKHVVEGHVVHETGKYPGTRGWAARWEKLEAQILPGEKWKDGVMNQIRLRPFSEAPSKIALVELLEDEYAETKEVEDEGADVFDEKYWDEFLDATDD